MEFTNYSFGPLLMKTCVDLDLCKELINTGKNQSNMGEYLSSVTFENSINYTPENILFFKNKIVKYINEYVKELSKYRKLEEYNFIYNLEELWINFQKHRDFNAPHFHAFDISFVIYVDIPEEIKNEKNVLRGFPNGSITFTYGQNLKRSDRKSSFNEVLNSYISPITQVTHLPSTGEMFIFPSYLNHYVAPFFTENIERISVAGNVSLLDGKNRSFI